MTISCCLLLCFDLDGNFLAIGSHDNYIYIYAVSENGRKYSRVGKCSVSPWIYITLCRAATVYKSVPCLALSLTLCPHSERRRTRMSLFSVLCLCVISGPLQFHHSPGLVCGLSVFGFKLRGL